MDDLVSSVAKFNPEIKTFDLSVFTGNYVTQDITEVYLSNLEAQRGAASRSKIPVSEDVIGLYNKE